MAKTGNPVSEGTLSDVSDRLMETYHHVVALHSMCVQQIGRGEDGVDIEPYTLLRYSLRAIARDLEHCAELVVDDVGGMGCFEAHFGKV